MTGFRPPLRAWGGWKATAVGLASLLLVATGPPMPPTAAEPGPETATEAGPETATDPGPQTATDVAASANHGRPNILLILLDDMREEGVMDVPEVLPLTKRWLVKGGTNFTEGYVTSSLCCPERATIWSGRVAHNHGVFDNYTGDNLDRDWIIPRYLRDAGYHTLLVGKFITNWKFRYEPPHFDAFAAFQGGYVDARFMVKDPGDGKPRSERGAYSTDYIADKAIEYINAYKGQDRPWFMQVAPHAPHNLKEGTKGGCDLKALYAWPARHDKTPVPGWRPTPAVTADKADKVSYVRRGRYSKECAEVTHTGHMKTLLAADEMVDRIMATLEANGDLGRTLVVFTSDNGYAWGERGLTSKGLPYTEHVKVPFLVRWDGVLPAGAVDTRMVSGEDFLPTFLQAAGYTPPRLRYPLDGRSFLPGEEGREVKYLEFGPVGRRSPSDYQGHRGIPTWASLRTPQWQYIEYYESDNTTVKFREYYDRTKDPWELTNLLADGNPATDPDVDALSARLQRLWTCAGTSGANPCP